jgi:hypothetical protein
VVVESPGLLKKRFVGVESGVLPPPPGGGAVFEGNPCHLTVIVEDPGELGFILNYRLMLRGTPGFPGGIVIFRSAIDTSVPGFSDATAHVFPRGICLDEGERIELEVLADNGDKAVTTARKVRVVASHCDYSNSIVRTKRTQLTDVFQDIFPAPPLGSLNSPISGSNGTPEYSFYANQPGTTGGANVKFSDGVAETILPNVGAPDPDVGPFTSGSVPMSNVGITLQQGMSVSAIGDDPSQKLIALTTWMEIGEED